MTAMEMPTSAFAPDVVATKVAERIRREPVSHSQANWLVAPGDVTSLSDPQEWDCGTRACVAGHAALVAYPQIDLRTAFEPDHLLRTVHDVRVDGRFVHLKKLGQEALGLDDAEAVWLFYRVQTQDAVLAALDRIAAGLPARQG